MDSRSRFAFLVLVLAQAAHSAEEYIFKLYDVFVPARFVSGLDIPFSPSDVESTFPVC